MAAAAAAALLPPLLLLLLLQCAGPAAACNGMEVRGLTLKSCDQESVARVINSTVRLTDECKLVLRICFGVRKQVDVAVATYTVARGALLRRSGTIDLCAKAREEYTKRQQEIERQGGGDKRNVFKALLCPMQKGPRCIREVMDLSQQKTQLSAVQGEITMELKIEHGGAGKSCSNGKFVLAKKQRQQNRQRG